MEFAAKDPEELVTSLCFSRFSRFSPRSLFFAEREGLELRELAGGVPVCEPILDVPNDLRLDLFDFAGESSDAGDA